MYKIIPIRIKSKSHVKDTFAIIDSGSGISLIDATLADEMNLHGLKDKLIVEWTDNTQKIIEDSEIITTMISGPSNTNYTVTLRTIELILPTQSISSKELSQLGIVNNSMIPYHNAVPKILLGLDNAVITYAISTHNYGNLVLCKTPLGWTLKGTIGMPQNKDNKRAIKLL